MRDGLHWATISLPMISPTKYLTFILVEVFFGSLATFETINKLWVYSRVREFEGILGIFMMGNLFPSKDYRKQAILWLSFYPMEEDLSTILLSSRVSKTWHWCSNAQLSAATPSTASPTSCRMTDFRWKFTWKRPKRRAESIASCKLHGRSTFLILEASNRKVLMAK